MKKVYIETMGCQMNKSDAERMFGMLEHLGYYQTEEPKEADMLIINTCSVRQLSEDKAFSAIGVWGKWKKEEFSKRRWARRKKQGIGNTMRAFTADKNHAIMI